MSAAGDLVSIIMPAWNSEKTIAASIKSVLAQTFEDFELLVINDCSADGTAQIAASFAEGDARVRLLENEKNSGVAFSRNTGVKAAKGSWIAFLDSDDLWEKDKLEKQMALAKEQKDASILFTGSAFIDANGKRKDYTLAVPSQIDYRTLLKQNLISCSSVLIRRDLMAKYPMPEDNRIHEDFAVWLQVLKNGGKAYGINEPLLIYRLSPDSKSGNKRKAARMNWGTYAYLKIPFLKRIGYMCSYTVRSLKKYARL